MEVAKTKQVDVKLTVSKSGVGCVYPVITVGNKKTLAQTLKSAKIKWLNDYVNRDGLIKTINNLVEGQAIAKVKITNAHIIS